MTQVRFKWRDKNDNPQSFIYTCSEVRIPEGGFIYDVEMVAPDRPECSCETACLQRVGEALGEEVMLVKPGSFQCRLLSDG